MPDLIERGFDAMRTLRLEAESYWRAAYAAGFTEPSPEFLAPTLRTDTAVTPNGLEIVKTGDMLDVSADFTEMENGRSFEVTYDIEFPADMRSWPNAYKSVYTASRHKPDARSHRANVSRLPRTRFYEVARRLSGLIVASEMSV